MMPAITRAAIVTEAMTWVSTPFAHHQQLKGVGVDCAHLMRGVLNGAGAAVSKPGYYSQQWHLHRSEEQFADFVMVYGDEIPETELESGDMILWKFGRCFSHGGIYIGERKVVHAICIERNTRVASIDEGDLSWRPRRCFRYKALSDV